MKVILLYTQQYWGIIVVVIGAILFLVSQGKAKAAQIILSIMLRVEKQAEDYAIKTGDEKFGFVIERGYELLPKYVRMIITYSMFEDMAEVLYNKAKEYFISIEKTLETKEQEDKAKDPG